MSRSVISRKMARVLCCISLWAPLFKGKLQGAAKRKTISYEEWLKERGRLVCEGRKTEAFLVITKATV